MEEMLPGNDGRVLLNISGQEDHRGGKFRKQLDKVIAGIAEPLKSNPIASESLVQLLLLLSPTGRNSNQLDRL